MSKSPTSIALESPLRSFGLRADPAAARDAGVLAAELPHLGYVVLRGRSADPAFTAGVAHATGAPPPTQPMSHAPCRAGEIVWVSPDEWLLVCPRRALAGLVTGLTAALAGVDAQVVDNSGGLTALRLAGRDHLRVLRHLGPYDFEGMPVGRCVGTVFSKTSVMVVRTDEAGVVLVFRRSFADYLWRLFERAARPYGLCVVEPAAVADPLFAPLFAPLPEPLPEPLRQPA